MDLEKLQPKDRDRILGLLEKKQSDQFMTLYSYVVDNCFRDCVGDFTSSSLGDAEGKCVNRCAEKLLLHANRMGTRMAEKQIAPQ